MFALTARGNRWRFNNPDPSSERVRRGGVRPCGAAKRPARPKPLPLIGAQGQSCLKTKIAILTQRLHLVFRGELISPTGTSVQEMSNDIHVVGCFPNYASAYDACKKNEGTAQRRITRISGTLIAHLQPSLRERRAGSVL